MKLDTEIGRKEERKIGRKKRIEKKLKKNYIMNLTIHVYIHDMHIYINVCIYIHIQI